jgi:hypothetical protein
MKFNKNMVISSEPMKGNQVLLRTRDTQDIIKEEIAIGSKKSRLPNMSNLHTSSVCGVDLFLARVFLPHSKFVQLARDMVGRPCVRVPCGVHIVTWAINIVSHLLITSKIVIKSLPAT